MKVLNRVTRLGLIAVFAMGVLSFAGCGEDAESKAEKQVEKYKKLKEQGKI